MEAMNPLGEIMDNIILIGMPAAGKSTVGVLLAKTILYDFVDCDLLIQRKYDSSLCDLIETRGEDAFVQLENELLSTLDYQHTIIATGGSAIYGKEAMEHLSSLGTVVYLKLDLPEIERRIGNIQTRGVVMHHNTSMEDMYLERCALYEKYADITVDLSGLSTEGAVAALLSALFERFQA